MDPFNCVKNFKIVIFALLAIYLGPRLVNVAANVAVKEPTPYWQEHWDDHEQNLTLIYSDPYIAFYADSNDNANRTDLFIPLSFAWEFVHWVYNRSDCFGADPRLYVILHSNKQSDSRLNLFTNASADYQNIIECGEPDRERFCTSGDILDSIDVLVKKVSTSQEKPGALNLISEWQILFIVVYDKLVQDGRTDVAEKLKAHFQNKTACFPKGRVYLNQKWYLWIYDNYGGSIAIQSFLSLYDNYTSGSSTSISNFSSRANLTPGEFVFLWSEAVGSDLRDLAYFTFGWFRHYRKQFVEAREKLSFSTFPESYPNSSWYHPRTHFQNKPNLSLFDGHVAFYLEHSDDEVGRDTEMLTTFISKVWRFVNQTLGPLEPDPVLHLHLYFTSTFSVNCDYLTSEEPEVYEPGLHISCKFGEASEPLYNLWIMGSITSLALPRIVETKTWPANDVSDFLSFRFIFQYAVCIALLTPEDAKIIKDHLTDKIYNYVAFTFINWYYPVYSKYGGGNIVRQFLSTLHSNWPKRGTEFVGQMNAGEFVHFWSAAVGEDLLQVAIQTRDWSQKNNDELVQARRQYSQLNDNYVIDTSLPQSWKDDWGGRNNYDEELHLVYSDKNVAFYLDSGLDRNITWPFKLMSSAWEYVNHKYGSLTGYPLLFIFLHNTTSECKDSKTDRNAISEHKNVIDCGQSNGSWGSEVQSADLLLQRLGHMILADGKNTGKWLGYTASHWSMKRILVYDIYLNLGLEEDARRWKERMFRDTEEVPSPNTFWFRDFYYIIYKNFGGSQTLSNFISVLYSKWPYKDYNAVSYEDPDLETLIHFWSAAAGENQWRLAGNAFGWNTQNYRKFLKARRFYPLNYTDNSLGVLRDGEVLVTMPFGRSDCDTYFDRTIGFPSEKRREFWKNHTKEITLVYVDANVAVYYDSDMDFDIKYPFELVSQAWKFAQTTYGPIRSDNILYVVLHAENVEENNEILEVTNHNRSFHSVYVLECTRRIREWKGLSADEILRDLIHLIGVIIVYNPEEINLKSFHVGAYNIIVLVRYELCKEVGLTNLALSEPNGGFFFQIYARHGGSKGLKSFLKIFYSSKQLFSDRSDDDAINAEFGRIMHFWSGAVGVNLSYLATTVNLQKKFQEAAANYSWIKYDELDPAVVELYKSTPLLLNEENFHHKELLTNVYVDSTVAIYFDIKVHKAVQWPFRLLSEAWKQTQTGYVTLKTALNSTLNVFLHSNGPTGCHSLWPRDQEGEVKSKKQNDKEQVRAAQKVGEDKKKNEEREEKKIIIDCGIESSNIVGWSEETSENTDALMVEIANTTQQSANQFLGEEAYDRAPFTEMLVFDLYLKLGRLDDAHRVLRNRIDISDDVGRFWKRNWYLPIYTQYGGTSVFSKFLFLLAKHWNQPKLKENKKNPRRMNIGEFVHFWSAAAGTNLHKIAENAFGWVENHKDLDQFDEARKMFPFNYACYDCHIVEKQNESNRFKRHVSIGFGVVALAAAVLFLCGYRKYKILQNQIRELTEDEIKEFHEGTSDTNTASNNDGNATIASRPFDKAFEIPREILHVVSDQVLGSGEFGVVLRGVIKSHGERFTIDTIAAVKTVKPNADVTYFKSFLTELKVMAFLGPHANIASLLGACTLKIRNREVFVAIEFCAKGDLLGFLKNNRCNFSNLIVKQDNSNAMIAETSFSSNQASINNKADSSNGFSTVNLLDWSIQIANGMAFIASKNVIHGDLAARNVLITADNIAKISDFGLSKQLANYSNYVKTSKTPVPWRWMAIESLQEMNFSIRSDVWAFGVTLFEIFSLGLTPYPGCTCDHKFIEMLENGERVSPPSFGNVEIYYLMMDCMKKEPMERILFPEMIPKLESMKSELVQTTGISSSSYVQLSVKDDPKSG